MKNLAFKDPENGHIHDLLYLHGWLYCICAENSRLKVKNLKTTLFITLYNGRIDISHIVKTLGIILINLTNTIVQNIVMAYSHILMVMLGEEVEEGRV